jgi:phenylacetate-CoA ligase
VDVTVSDGASIQFSWLKTMELGQTRSWLSRNIFIPWIINGPWTSKKRSFRAAGAEARAAFNIWDQSDPEKRAQWMLKELRGIVRWAGHKVPYYREVFKKAGFDPSADFSFADYRKLPPLGRDIVRERSDDLIAEGFSKRSMKQNSTGGSTGVPVRFWVDEPSLAWRSVASEWGFAKIGYRAGDRTGLIWGFSADPRAQRSLRARASSWLAHNLVNDCYRLDDEILDEIDRRLSNYQPSFLRCYVSALTLLALRLRQQGKRPNYPTRGILTGAEKLDSRQREIINDVFPVPLYESYGGRDSGLIAMQLKAADTRLRVAGANILAEPHGGGDPEFGSEILITDLHRKGMPLLRYRMGDCARFPQVSADAPVEFLEEVAGRTVDLILLPGGKTVHGIQFPRLFRDFDICEYQVVQDAGGDVRVSLIPGPQLKSDDMVRIERILRDNLVGISLSVSLASTIERTAFGKLRPVISHYKPVDRVA